MAICYTFVSLRRESPVDEVDDHGTTRIKKTGIVHYCPAHLHAPDARLLVNEHELSVPDPLRRPTVGRHLHQFVTALLPVDAAASSSSLAALFPPPEEIPRALRAHHVVVRVVAVVRQPPPPEENRRDRLSSYSS